MATYSSSQENEIGLTTLSESKVGLPFNILQYYALKELVADCIGVQPGTIFWKMDNAHIYNRHLEKIDKQVNTPLSSEVANSECKLILPDIKEGKHVKDPFFYRPLSEVKFTGYKHMGKYEYEVAI